MIMKTLSMHTFFQLHQLLTNPKTWKWLGNSSIGDQTHTYWLQKIPIQTIKIHHISFILPCFSLFLSIFHTLKISIVHANWYLLSAWLPNWMIWLKKMFFHAQRVCWILWNYANCNIIYLRPKLSSKSSNPKRIFEKNSSKLTQ
jgi:hypothetical protein